MTGTSDRIRKIQTGGSREIAVDRGFQIEGYRQEV